MFNNLKVKKKLLVGYGIVLINDRSDCCIFHVPVKDGE